MTDYAWCSRSSSRISCVHEDNSTQKLRYRWASTYLPYGKIAPQFLNLTTSRGQESTRFRLQLFEERHRPPSVVTPVAPKFCADPSPIEGTEQSVHPVRRARQRAAAPRPGEMPLVSEKHRYCLASHGYALALARRDRINPAIPPFDHGESRYRTDQGNEPCSSTISTAFEGSESRNV